jgi:hypothetical protein
LIIHSWSLLYASIYLLTVLLAWMRWEDDRERWVSKNLEVCACDVYERSAQYLPGKYQGNLKSSLYEVEVFVYARACLCVITCISD